MKHLTAAEIARIIGARVVAGDAGVLMQAGVCTDTRKLEPGCLFFALRGENFDANAFAEKALQGGAAIAVVSDWHGGNREQGTVLLVADTLVALQTLADWWRDQLSLAVVGLTGSNGKTSTKDFTAAVLRKKYAVCATRGNLNNHIGLPLTVLETSAEHGAAVYEMGMNHPGEIAPLTALAKPQIAVITNVGSSHIEFMGSREAIAREKAAIAANMSERDTLIVPHDCDFLELIRSLTKARILTTGGADDAIRAENFHEVDGAASFTLVIDDQHWPVSLSVAGKHMVANALLAAAVGSLLGVAHADIAAGLREAVLTSGRLRRFIENDIVVFDDTYNANPESMLAGLETLASAAVGATGRRYAVLGRMGELGDHAEDGCRRVGQRAGDLGLNTITVGDEADAIARYAGPLAKHFSTHEQAADYLRGILVAGDVVLFKGSRTSAMERVMKQIFSIN